MTPGIATAAREPVTERREQTDEPDRSAQPVEPPPCLARGRRTTS